MTATAVRPPLQSTDVMPAGHDVQRTMLALLASALGVLPLCEVLSDRGWLIDVWLTMLVVIGPAALLRTRRAPSAVQVWIGVVLLVPWLTLNFLRAHAFAGIIPLGRSGHDLGALLTALHHTTSTDVAPIHSTPAVRLALCAVLGLVAALVDLIAVVGRRGALAGVPLLIVFTVSGAVPRQPVSWWLFALAGAAFLVLLALDSSDDLHRWGHFVPRPGGALGQARRSGSGQRIAVVAIAAAIVLPAFIPSNSRNFVANLFHNSGHGDTGGGFGANGGGGSISPFAELKGELNRPKPLDLFTVTIPKEAGAGLPRGVEPFYLRENVLPTFVGDGWITGAEGPLEDAVSTQFPNAPGQAYQPRTVDFTAHFSINHLDSNPPVFADPTAISGSVGSGTEWSPQNHLLVGSRVHGGQSFDEAIAQPAPTVDDLRSSPQAGAAMAGWLDLPSVPTYVHNLVDRLTTSAAGPYDRVRAISNYFSDPKNGFSYSIATKTGDSGNALVDFLHQKVGFCQQYAAAMAVMLRLAHVPARVVLGYAHDVPDGSGTFTVTTDDAHAWVEAYFEGIGWVPFDPTPLAGITGGSANDLPWAPHHKLADVGPVGPGANRSTPPTAPVKPPIGQQPGTPAAGPADSGSSAVALIVLAGVAGLLVLLALTPLLVRWQRRRRLLHRARHGDTDALWRELSATATDLGYGWSDARTPRQVQRWLAASSGAGAALQALTAQVERSRYAPPTARPDGARLVSEFDKVRRAMRAGLGPRERLRATLWPASLALRVPSWRGRQLRPRRVRVTGPA